MSEDRGTIERSIWTARPTRLVQTVRESIDSWLGVPGAEILLVDYHQSHLIPFADGDGGTPDSQHGGTQHSSTLLLRFPSAPAASPWPGNLPVGRFAGAVRRRQ